MGTNGELLIYLMHLYAGTEQCYLPECGAQGYCEF